MSKLIAVFALGLALSWPLPPWADVSSVYQYTSSASYYGEWYTGPPSSIATRIYFQGEMIGVQVQIHNDGEEKISITDVKQLMDRNFRPEILSAPTEASKHKLIYDFVPNFKLVPIGGRVTAISPLGPLALGAKDSLIARFTIKTSNGSVLPKGIYNYRVISLLKASRQDIKVNNDDFTFEVRDVRSIDDRLELLRREATHAVFVSKNADRARQKIDTLLKLHPNSDVAYTLLGTLEYNRGQIKRAIAAYEKAIELMRTRKDTIVLKYKTKLVLDQAQGTIVATLNAWKQQQSKSER